MHRAFEERNKEMQLENERALIEMGEAWQESLDELRSQFQRLIDEIDEDLRITG